MFFVFTEVLWTKIIQLLSNKTTSHSHVSPMSKVDQSLLPRIYSDPKA